MPSRVDSTKSASSTDSLAIASLLSGNLAAAHATLTQAVARRVESMGVDVRPREYAVLVWLSTRGDCALADVSAYLLISPTSVRQIVTRLSTAGWVRSTPGCEDRRFRNWAVSGAGAELIARVSGSGAEASIAAALQALSIQERSVIRSQTFVLLAALQPGAHATPGSKELQARFSAAMQALNTFGALVDVWLVFSRLYRLMRAQQTRFLARATNHQLDSATYMALYRINEHHANLTDLATFLRVDQNTAVRVADRLEALGLLERKRNKANRRHILLTPTTKGTALLVKVPPLDLEGDYFKAIVSLPEHGALFAAALAKLMSGYLHEPVVNHEKLYSLFEQVQRAAGEAAAPLDSGHFRKAMSNFATGVAVVTVADGEGWPKGVTVNSLTSVSLEPPILLICFDRRSSGLKRVQEVGAFGVNILSAGQRPLAQQFARGAGKEDLDQGDWVEMDGLPMLAGSLVRITCELEQTFEAGTHTVVFGRPRQVAFRSAANASPAAALGYWQSSYLEINEQHVAIGQN